MGLFWHPLRLSMHNRGVAVRVACQLHNICIDAQNCSKVKPVHHGMVPGFVKQISIMGILPLLFNSQMEPVSDLATDLI
jgi:hypothetical protein